MSCLVESLVVVGCCYYYWIGIFGWDAGTKGVYETKYYYVAHIKRGYEVRKAFFSKNQLGEKEALRRAKAQRLSWQRELDKHSF